MTTERTYPTEEIEAIREGLAGKSGPDYWRSLDELSQTGAFREYIHNEFPLYAPSTADGVSRRNFLQVMGSTLALAGVTAGCARQPKELIVPYVKPPEEVVPGKPLFFATSHVDHGYAKPILVESHMGRPTKIEGLPGHPASLGRTDAQTQASILDMYDPDRAKAVTHLGRVAAVDDFVKIARQAVTDSAIHKGEGIRILTGAVTSPSLAAQLADLKKAYPKLQWHQYEPAGRDAVRAGALQAFGEYADTAYHFDQADVIVSLDADFFDRGPANVRYTSNWAERRDVVDGLAAEDAGAGHGEAPAGEGHALPEGWTPRLNRMYAFESSPNNVGANADHRWPVRPSQIEAVARRLAVALGLSVSVSDEDGLSGETADAIQTVAADLKAHRGKAIIVAGDHQPAVVHALAHAMNDALGNVGKTVSYIEPVEAQPEDQFASIAQLTSDMDAGKVQMLIVFGGNPVYNAPADLNFLDALKKAPLRAHVSPYLDETGEWSQWHIPESHYLEAWGDARAFDGTVSLIQPLIAPFYDSFSPGEILSAIFDEEPRTGHDILQDYWKSLRGEDGFDAFWRLSLSEGYVADTAYPPKRVRVRDSIDSAYSPVTLLPGTLEVAILPDPCIGDGTWSNNAWLMELPRPLTKLTWDNAVLVGYSTARRLGLDNEDVVEVVYNGVTLRGPVSIQPGHCADTITLNLGFGRTRVGKVAQDMGFDVYPVLTTAAPTLGAGATIKKTAAKYRLARTEEHYNMEGRELVRHVDEATVTANPGIVQHGEHHTIHTPTEHETLYDPEEKKWNGYAWGMTIDLNKCTGCNACIVACQSENIIPVVGKIEVHKGREMQWIRVDRYYHAGDASELAAKPLEEQDRILDNPTVYYQPVPCMQCENAPCELVCPVGATQHSREGLNDMVYNRCIGTRYCANNCPYKVRRFNFFNYSRTPLGSDIERLNPLTMVGDPGGPVHPESLKAMRNPNVTIRGRGVMEKCTYCVQRINFARIEAKKSGEKIRDDQCVSACQQACPAGAITFGDINNPDSAVSKRKGSHRNYGLLAELNTRPRTTYLARVTNPNPELSGPRADTEHTETEA